MNLTLYIILTLIALFLIGMGLYFYFYKSKKNTQPAPKIVQKPSVFEQLGITEDSGSINMHFQFPEKKDSMSENMLNKYKVGSNEKKAENHGHKHSEHSHDKEHNEHDFDHLKKEKDSDYNEKEDRSFDFDLKNAILSHEILKKKGNH